MTGLDGHPVLTVEHLHVVRAGRCVLQDVCCSIPSGQCTAVVGPNGAGKSTLLLAMLGLLPIERGEVRLAGRPLSQWGARKNIARRIAYVPQEYEGFCGFTVYDMIATGRYAHAGLLGLPGPQDRRAVEQAVQTCGLAGLEDRVLNRLSGGERQKVWLATALAQQSDIFFLDEPATALDPRRQQDMTRLWRGLLEIGKTVVIVCHDLNLALALESRILALRQGRLLFDGPVGRFVEGNILADVFEADFDRFMTPGGDVRLYPKI